MKKIDYTLSLMLGSMSNMAALLEQCEEMAGIETDKDIDRALKKLERVGKLLVEIIEPIAKRIHATIEGE